ncbi:hypothetical protein Tco_0540613 [Tanacetum coccineum]
MNDSKSFNKHIANQVLYHALMEVLITDEEAMDKDGADSLKQQKRPHDDEDEDPLGRDCDEKSSSTALQRRVEDVQLGVKSYRKKFNLTKLQKTYLGLECKQLFTPSFDPPGVIYEDLNKQKRVMRADELIGRDTQDCS